MEKYYFIRSARIIQALHEATLATFKNNIERGFPRTKKRQYATDPISISELKITPYVGTKSLLIRGTANSRTKQGSRIYDPLYFFTQVQYEGEDSARNVTFVASDGKEYHIQPISFQDDNARVRCNCLDFHYRFSHYNAKERDLYGRPPPPYQRKTTHYPPVNPMKVSGVCKHLLKLAEALEESGMLSPTPRIPTPDIEPPGAIETEPEAPEAPPQEEVPPEESERENI